MTHATLKRPVSMNRGLVTQPLNEVRHARITTKSPIRGYEKQNGEYTLADQLRDEKFNNYCLNHMRQAR